MKYNPNLTIEENAKINGCSEATIRYYIKTSKIDRRFDRKKIIVSDCANAIKTNTDAIDENGEPVWNNLQKITGHSLSTIRKYRKEILNVVSGGCFIDNKTLAILDLLGIPHEYYEDNEILNISGIVNINGTAFDFNDIRGYVNIGKTYGNQAKKQQNKTGIVYFGKAPDNLNTIGLTKIGHTALEIANKRLSPLKTSFPGFYYCKMIKCGTVKDAHILETQLHETYKDYRVDGEWFDLPENILNEIYEKYGAVSFKNHNSSINSLLGNAENRVSDCPACEISGKF